MERYLKMKKEALEALAREARVRGRSRMNKKQLARALWELSNAVERDEARLGASLAPLGRPMPEPEPPVTPDLPAFLGETRLCLLPQKPMTAFAYWEFGDDRREDVTFRVLSFPDGSEVMSTSVRGRLGTFYIHLPRPGMEIESVLGVQGPDGFIELVRSNRIKLPDDAPTEVVDTLWMTRRREFEEIFRLSGGADGKEVKGGGYGLRGPGVPVSSWSGGEVR